MPFWRYGLAPPPADFATRLRVVRAGSAAVELRRHGLVHHGLVDRRREKRLGQVDRAKLLAHLREEGRAGHHLAFLTMIIALRAGQRALDQEQVALGVAAHDGHLLDGDAVVAHPPGHARALEHLARVRAGADRAGLAVRVGAVRLRSAPEVVALDGAGEARGPWTRRSRRPSRPSANRDTSSVWPTSYSDTSSRRNSRACLTGGRPLSWPSARLGQLLGRAGAELDGGVAVALGRAQRGHRIRFDRHHRDGHDRAVLREDRGHADLPGRSGRCSGVTS